jgi:hypothetical protein
MSKSSLEQAHKMLGHGPIANTVVAVTFTPIPTKRSRSLSALAPHHANSKIRIWPLSTSPQMSLSKRWDQRSISLPKTDRALHNVDQASNPRSPIHALETTPTYPSTIQHAAAFALSPSG